MLKKSYPKRNPRSTEEGEEGKKCGYTFIVPEQKITGPICVNTKGPSPGNKKDEITRMDIENLKEVLFKQKREIDLLQLVVDVDGNIVNEVKLLRKESRNMNSRVTQLYMQLLHEIIRKRDNSLELSQLENKILNVTTEMLKMTSRYRELEIKYAALTDLVNNQSVIITLLEEQCLRIFSRQDAHGSPPLVPVVPHHIPNNPHYNPTLLGSNEIQRDPGYPRERDKGFGNVAGEYWLGLENIYLLSNQDNYRLLIELEDWSNKKVYAEYSSFRLEPESEYYRLRLGTYQGNAGDSMIWHNGKQFTTLDRDRDMHTGKK
ncbi:Angiopoietin-related protein 1, partial [Ophiophagus hannah]